MNFEQDPAYAGLPPLDKMRKVRRDILRTINDFREKYHSPGLYLDPLTNRAAMEYAQMLLEEDQDENETLLR